MNVLAYCKPLKADRYHLCRRALARSHSTSTKVRSMFLDYFKSEDHVILPSSPVLPPPHDKSLSFTNAGMNQFKGVFLGEAEARYPRAANSQKCVRVGGKHNDLNVVGRDSTHLTMFEMLGSWSFGDYWKSQSCRLAWSLVTEVYRLDREKLWVTYFGGSGELEPDYETRDIWLSLGVPESRLVGLGMSDNFWEMGLSGPCGPCTELHYNPTGAGGLENCTEIWNIVFIQHHRQLSGLLSPLSTAFVDTGMGLERMTAVLDNSFTNSNIPDVFQTDLMAPMLEHLSKVTRQTPYSGSYSTDCSLDFGYRVLADHTRMVTVCLADGMLPDDSHRLRNVLRRGQSVARTVFNSDVNIIRELSYKVVESLGDHFLNLRRNHERILTILDYEHENYSKLLERGMKFMKKINLEFPDIDTREVDVFDSHNYYESLKCVRREAEHSKIGPRLAFKLYESHGMEEQDIEHLAHITSYKFDLQQFQLYFSEQKNKSKYSSALSRSDGSIDVGPKVPVTEDEAKYEYKRLGRSAYQFPQMNTRIASVLSDGGRSSRITAGERGALITTHTNFYSEAGGQAGDSGTIKGDTGTFLVEVTTNISGHVLHTGRMVEGFLAPGESVQLTVDPAARLSCMRQHTATHLLNSSLNSLLAVTAQRSSNVNTDYLRFNFAVFNNNFDLEMLEKIEANVLDKIKSAIPVKLTTIDSSEMEGISKLITLPGELYPPEVRLVDVGDHVEPCCGTHLLNTEDLEDFCIVDLKSPSPGVRSVKCLTADRAVQARLAAQILVEQVESLKERLDKEDPNILMKTISDLQSRLSCQDLPFIISEHLKSELVKHQQTVRSVLRASSKEKTRDLVLRSLREQEHLPYFCQYVEAGEAGKFSLSTALKSVPADKPAVLLARIGNEIKGKAVIPGYLSSSEFSARKWLDVAKLQLGGRTAAPRGQSETVNCNLMGGKVVSAELLDSTVRALKEFANHSLSLNKLKRDN